ncbi:hypothetical protein NliqN6_3775 [Naganishia liquefaciens]|uniref:BD-FAE-like domain-containing protein n=1 Tax=Naganishia liquefaciens TaxID=104408 RepID=A0A8H3TUJ7_9TREE|nr:hypothetical protein NliqN6_3775 [Naganishia liquefaciens]
MYAPPRTLVYDRAHPVHCSLDVYTPRQPVAQRDVLVFIHGGAWRSGDKSDHADLPSLVADAFARHGATAPRPLPTILIPNYRLSTHPDFPDRQAVVHPTPIHDVARAFEAFTADDDEWRRGEIARVVWAGHSCGAHILSHLLLNPSTTTTTTFLPGMMDKVILPRTHAVAFLDGILNVRALAREYPDYVFFIDAAFGADPGKRWQGADAFEEDDQPPSSSSSSSSRSVTPPTAALRGIRKWLVAHASEDELLTPAQGQLFRDHLCASGFADVVEWDEQTLRGTHDGCLHDRGVGELLYRLFA